MCRSKGIECFRGDLDDVLDRFYHAALQCDPDHIVRITGDCPLLDPEVMDGVIEKHIEGNYDYTSNTAPPSFPDGLDVEVFRFSALADAWKEARLHSEREHVTPFIRNNPGRYRMGNLLNGEDLSSLRWTVDERRDLDFVRRVYEYLFPEDPAFGMDDVLRLLEQKPELMEINCGIARNEGYYKSLREDADLAAKEG
jgi:spore coat polysaccharide biosynthesis protein SpsF